MVTKSRYGDLVGTDKKEEVVNSEFPLSPMGDPAKSRTLGKSGTFLYFFVSEFFLTVLWTDIYAPVCLMMDGKIYMHKKDYYNFGEKRKHLNAHSFIHLQQLDPYLGQGHMDPGFIPGSLGTNQEYTLDGAPVHHRTLCTHSFTISSHTPSVTFLGRGRKPKNPHGHREAM